MIDTIITILGIVATPIASIIAVWITAKQTQKKVLAQQIKEHEEMIKQTNEIMMLTLRNDIQGIYAIYKHDQCIPSAVYSGCCEMFDLYKEKGGNCYIDTIMKEMRGWLVL